MGENDDNFWASIVPGPSERGPLRPSGLYGSFLGSIPTALAPAQPSATTYSQIREAEQRFEKRLQKLRDIFPIVKGRVVPADDDLPIGDARRLRLAVLFLDICEFSRVPSYDDNDQDKVLKLLKLFMAEMLHVVRALRGDFEKNTGDGMMAYFKDGTESECAQRAVDAAVTMHCYNDQVISPRLKTNGLPEVRFRVGIETGLVTIANVGVRGDHHSLVAIGNVPNVACKLMNLIQNGGIVLGHYTRNLMSEDWQRETSSIGPERFSVGSASVHKRIHSVRRYKGSFFAAASTALIGTSISSSILDSLLRRASSVWSGPQWLAGFGLLLLSISVVLSVMAIRPRLWNKTPIGFIFWDGIVGHQSAANFSQAIHKTTAHERTSAIAEHLFVLAAIAKRKYAYVNYAVWAAIVGGVLTAIALFLQHTLR